MKLDGARIVLTGAASGIGRAILAELARYDAQIMAADQDKAALENAAALFGKDGKVRIITHGCDIGTQEGVDSLFGAALDAMGGIDLFIANAGIAYYENYARADWNHIETIYRINVFSPLYTVAKMRELHADGTPYTTAITASAMSKLAYPGYSLYSGTKAALDHFATAARFEAPPNETLTLIYPVATRTPFFQRAGGRGEGADRADAGRMPPRGESAPITPPSQTPEWVAGVVVRGLQAGVKSIFPSPTFLFLSIVHRVIPILKLSQWMALAQFRQWQAEQTRSR